MAYVEVMRNTPPPVQIFFCISVCLRLGWCCLDLTLRSSRLSLGVRHIALRTFVLGLRLCLTSIGTLRGPSRCQSGNCSFW